jgi:hypothetical protein
MQALRTAFRKAVVWSWEMLRRWQNTSHMVSGDDHWHSEAGNQGMEEDRGADVGAVLESASPSGQLSQFTSENKHGKGADQINVTVRKTTGRHRNEPLK